jgi:hypothetical protein
VGELLPQRRDEVRECAAGHSAPRARRRRLNITREKVSETCSVVDPDRSALIWLSLIRISIEKLTNKPDF